MLNRVYKVTKDTGLNARIASELVTLCSKFSSKITLNVKQISVDFKSIMGVMSLNVQKGEFINVVVEGIDENKAFDEIDLLIKELDLGKEY